MWPIFSTRGEFSSVMRQRDAYWPCCKHVRSTISRSTGQRTPYSLQPTWPRSKKRSSDRATPSLTRLRMRLGRSKSSLRGRETLWLRSEKRLRSWKTIWSALALSDRWWVALWGQGLQAQARQEGHSLSTTQRLLVQCLRVSQSRHWCLSPAPLGTMNKSA